MQAIKTKPLEKKHKRILIVLAVIGALQIWLPTWQYGAGLVPASARLIAAARHILSGEGYTTYLGTPQTAWPPLYPLLLTLISRVTGLDPLQYAHLVNVVLFGLTIYLGGMFMFRRFSDHPTIAVLGTVGIMTATPIFVTGLIAGQAPLFILLSLLVFLSGEEYARHSSRSSLLFLSISAGLAGLTNFAGSAFIVWGVMIIGLFGQGKRKQKIRHLAIYGLIAGLPIGLWVLRNYFFIDNAPIGAYLFYNIQQAGSTILAWYLPQHIVNNGAYLIPFTILVVFFGIQSLKGHWEYLSRTIQLNYPAILFTGIYFIWVVFTHRILLYARVNNEVMAVVFVPLTLVIIDMVLVVAGRYRERFSDQVIRRVLVVGMLIWLILPARDVYRFYVHFTGYWQVYRSEVWRQSALAAVLRQQPDVYAGCDIYTNEPDAAYILGGVQAGLAPPQLEGMNAPDKKLKKYWPAGDNICLVWFEASTQPQLLSPKEAQAFVDLTLMYQTEDGAIYRITPKSD